MKLLERLKKAKKGAFFLVIGSTFLILFFLLLGVHHLTQLKVANAFKTFNAESEYKMMISPMKKEEKRHLFDYQEYHFYGIGIENIGISYNGVAQSLKNVLKKEFITFTDFLNDWQFISASSDGTIKKYENASYCLYIEQFNAEEVEVILKKVK